MKKSKAQKGKPKRGIPGFPYPSEIIELRIRRNLSIKEAYFLMCLLNGMNKKNRACWKSETTLAKEMGCSRATLALIRNSLEEDGIIEVGKREKWHGHFALNEYKIVYPWTSSPCLKSGHGALSDFSKPPCLKSGHKSVNKELVKKSISQGKKLTKKTLQDTSLLTDLTGKVCRQKPKDKAGSAAPISSVRGDSHDSKYEIYDPWDPKQQARGEKEKAEEIKRILDDLRNGEFAFGEFGAKYKTPSEPDDPSLLDDFRIKPLWEVMYDRLWNKEHRVGGSRRLFFRRCHAEPDIARMLAQEVGLKGWD